jgi:uncharacterized membrane protein YgcG
VEAQMGEEHWAGDAAQDTRSLAAAVRAMREELETFVLSGGVADTIWDPAGQEAPAEVPADSFPAAGEAIGYVTDTAGIMTAEERQALEQAAQAISEKHGFGVYIITVDSFRDVTDSYDVFDGATTLYNKYDLGLGEERKGVLLLLSMTGRDFSLVTYSDYGNYVFDAVAREELVYAFRDDFSVDNWYDGFADYLADCDTMLAEGPEKVSSGITARVGIIFLAPLVVAAVVIVILGRKMKSVAAATQAEAYVGDGLTLTKERDQFTHSTQIRRKRKEESSGGGGGTRSKSSGGFGGTSGKF